VEDGGLSPKAILILATIAGGDRHGYAIRREIQARTGGAVRVGVTTLYRLLRQLLAAGFVEESERRPLPQLDDERRRYFTITPAGRKALRAELIRLERVLAAARQVPSKVRS
jgi:DNA-binding PadR family transcriptional regulator